MVANISQADQLNFFIVFYKTYRLPEWRPCPFIGAYMAPRPWLAADFLLFRWLVDWALQSKEKLNGTMKPMPPFYHKSGLLAVPNAICNSTKLFIFSPCCIGAYNYVGKCVQFFPLHMMARGRKHFYIFMYDCIHKTCAYLQCRFQEGYMISEKGGVQVTIRYEHMANTFACMHATLPSL